MRLVRKLLRYASVSVVATTVSLVILAALVAGGVTTPGWANVVATGVGTVPSFELNRRWVWGKSGRRSLWAEVGPFCLLSFTELGLSTVAVHAAAAWATGLGYGVAAQTAVAVGANVATFGSLWVAQFVLLDRMLFAAGKGPQPSAAPPAPAVPRPVVAGHREIEDPVRLPRAA